MDSTRIGIVRNVMGELLLERSGHEPLIIQPVRALPLSRPNAWIGLIDGQGKQVHMVRSLEELEPRSRTVLEEELDRLYFLPVICRIEAIAEEYGVLRVEVETDRGPRRFELSSGEGIQYLSEGRMLLRDSDGNRYQIPGLARLDARSRALAERYF